jgi:hypothetical protein
MKQDKNKNCTKHGFTLFKYKKNKKGEWYVCELCLKAQWRKAAAKRRKNPEVMDYHRDYSRSLNKIRKSLSVYLTMILLAAKIKPE